MPKSIWVRALRNITRHYPLNTPRALLLSRLPPVPAGFGEFRGKRGLRYSGYWSTSDEVSHSLFWLGDFDPWVNATILKLVRPDSVAIDVGANIGSTALVMAKAVGGRGRVFCFEPAPENLNYLKQNISENHMPWVTVFPLALSDRCGTLSMNVPSARAGTAHITTQNEGENSILVAAETFDQWIKGQPGLDISICKIDVEGHEEQVFAGMAHTLSTQAIPAIIFERLHVADAGKDNLFETLRDSGYKIFRIGKRPFKVHYDPIDGPMRPRATADFVALNQASVLKLS